MNFHARSVAWLLLVAFTTSAHSLAGEKIRHSKTTPSTTTRTTTTRYYQRPSNADSVAADVLIARPAWFAETVVGAGPFVVALPFAAASGSIEKTAHTLVTRPARATFRRT